MNRFINFCKDRLKILLGIFIMLLGICLMPVPGPGGLPTFLIGLGILAGQFKWAKALQKKISEDILSSPTFRRWKPLIIVFLILAYIVMTFVLYKLWKHYFPS